MEFDDGEPEPEVEGIPLADDLPAEPSRPKAKAAKGAASSDPTVTARRAEKTRQSQRRNRRTTPSLTSFSISISMRTTDRSTDRARVKRYHLSKSRIAPIANLL